ncbi:MAG: hypothetical protein J5604_03440 [Bacteroidales bacterium]|nr:hypothetical protein [Bacteroidales bacterium]
MKKKIKQFYEAPSALILEVTQEGVICASNPTPTYNNPFGSGEDWI